MLLTFLSMYVQIQVNIKEMQPKFVVDEKVLCYHGPLLYEAKVLKVRKEGSSYSYFVHYQGWNRNWDE